MLLQSIRIAGAGGCFENVCVTVSVLGFEKVEITSSTEVHNVPRLVLIPSAQSHPVQIFKLNLGPSTNSKIQSYIHSL